MDWLRLPKVDVEYAGMTKPDLFPREVCLFCKEDVALFYFGHNIGVSLDFLLMNASAVGLPHSPGRSQGKSTGS